MFTSRRTLAVRVWLFALSLLASMVGVIIGPATVASAAPTPTIAYVTLSTNSVAVVDTSTNTVTATIPVGSGPIGIATNPAGTRAYVTNFGGDTVSVIDTAGNTVIATIPVGTDPWGVRVNPAGTRVYVTNYDADSVSVIEIASNTVVATIPVGANPIAVGLDPTGTRAYVSNMGGDSVSVIDTARNTVVATIPVGRNPVGVRVNPAGTQVYVANRSDTFVSVIDTASNTVVNTISVGFSTPWKVAFNPAGTTAYLTHDGFGGGRVSVIDTATATIIARISGGRTGADIELDATGTAAYVADLDAATLWRLDTATNTRAAVVTGLTGAFGLALTGGTYRFSGFFPPVDNPPTINTMNAGAAVPVKFSLDGNQGLNIFAVGFPVSQRIDCDTSAPIDPVEETVTAGRSGLSYDPATDTYTYAWKTEKAWANTCRTLIVKLNDGTVHIAHFQFN